MHPNTTLNTALATLLLFCLLACRPSLKQAPRFRVVPAESAGIAFQNTIVEDSLHNLIDYSYCYNGGGVGAADLDNDGLQDLVFTGNQRSCAVYKNKGQWQFSDQTAKAGLQTSGWCTGVSFADVNADGWLDIYICRAGNYPAKERHNLLYINEKNFHFRESAAAYGLADTGWSTQALFFDYNRDGLLDCYVTNHTNTDRYPNRIKDRRNTNTADDSASDRLYAQVMLNGKRKFMDVTPKAGLGDDGWGLGVSVGDFNNDQWPDLYVSNDFMSNDLLWINQKNGRFLNLTTDYTQHTSHSSMGNDVGDFDNDGWEDIFVTDMMPMSNLQRKKMAGMLSNDGFRIMLDKGYTAQYMRNTLQWNRGSAQAGFHEIGQLTGMHATDWSWAPFWADLDLDGRQDMLVSAGYRHDITDMDFITQNSQLGSKYGLREADKQIRERAKQQAAYPSPIRFFRHEGGLVFSDSSQQWCDAGAAWHNGSIATDIDNDGDLDVLSNRIDQGPLLLENTDKSTKNWLKIRLSNPRGEPNGIGALVRIYTPEGQQQRRITTTRAYQSGVAPEAHFGLGKSPKIDSALIIWPDGSSQKETSIAANQSILIQAGPKRSIYTTATPLPAAISKLKMYQLFDPEKYQEYNEYANEPLLPHRYQHEYFPVVSADVNGDGQTDYFAGGPQGLSGTILLHTPKGLLAKVLHQKDEINALAMEDMGAAFFDADADGDQDLYVSSGGAQFEANSIFLQDRLYLNDGQGHFSSAAAGALPKEGMPGSCVLPADYDRDGDTDLFVGGRREPFRFGAPGQSMLLENDGQGHFKDVAEAIAPGLKAMGMVTCAQWMDIENDGQLDLVVAGEMMPITLVRRQQGTFKLETLPNSAGFWNCLTLADVNHDGRTDLLAGNIGLNQSLNIGPNSPFRVYACQFGKDQRAEIVCSYFVQHQEVVFHTRDELLRRVPPLRKKFLSYQDFGLATFAEMFDPKNTTMLAQAVEARSMYIKNTDKGFVMQALPEMVQSSPVGNIIPTENGYIFLGCTFEWDARAGNIPASAACVLSLDLTQPQTLHQLQTYGPAGSLLRGIWSTQSDTPDFLLFKDGRVWYRK